MHDFHLGDHNQVMNLILQWDRNKYYVDLGSQADPIYIVYQDKGDLITYWLLTGL